MLSFTPNLFGFFLKLLWLLNFQIWILCSWKNSVNRIIMLLETRIPHFVLFMKPLQDVVRWVLGCVFEYVCIPFEALLKEFSLFPSHFQLGAFLIVEHLALSYAVCRYSQTELRFFYVSRWTWVSVLFAGAGQFPWRRRFRSASFAQHRLGGSGCRPLPLL